MNSIKKAFSLTFMVLTALCMASGVFGKEMSVAERLALTLFNTFLFFINACSFFAVSDED